jgi:hypothetical protein
MCKMLNRSVAVASLVIYAVIAAFSTLVNAAPGGAMAIYVLLMLLGVVAAVTGQGRLRLVAVLATVLAFAGAVSEFRAGSARQDRIRLIYERAKQRDAATVPSSTSE